MSHMRIWTISGLYVSYENMELMHEERTAQFYLEAQTEQNC